MELRALFSKAGFPRWDGAGNAASDFTTSDEADLAAHAALTAAFIQSTKTQGGTAGAPTPSEVWRFNAPSGDTRGPFGLVVGGALFASTFDRVMYFGYNAADGGGRAVSAEPSFRWVIESDYDDGSKRSMEPYWEWAKAANTGRSVTDAVTTSGSKVLTSATGAFADVDRGAPITGAGIPADTYIAGITSSTSIVLSQNATATATGVTATITPVDQQRRPIFMQIRRDDGRMVSFQIKSQGLQFTDWQTDEVFASLTSSGFDLAGVIGQQTDTAVTVTAQNGKKATFQLSGTHGSLLLDSISADTWTLSLSGTECIGFAQRGTRHGDQSVSFSGSVTAMVPVARKDDTHTFYGRAQSGQTTRLLELIDSSGGFIFLVDSAQAAADETVVRLTINGALKRVVVGAADSGGTGYRVLRVAN